MFVLFGRKAKFRRVSGGRREKRRCPACDATATFVEYDKTSSYSLYFVELFDDTERVFVCGACGEAMSFDATGAPVLSERERAKLAKEAEKEAARARKAAEAEKRAQEAERVRRERAREVARERQERALDDELAALKRRVRDEG
ncbi:MAG: hypothetical protein H6722_11870 [Sandaracinus sp.]|nr:hypothetical protein [Sandaracinus sp.]MCB9625062.1 hypothetical protein [Sandaracinus sp.]